MTFTKEQLIEQAKGCQMLAQCAVDARPDDVAAAKNLALVEIALAALTAVPIYQLINDDWYDADKETYDAVVAAGGTGRVVYVTPQPCPRCGVASTRPNGEHYCHVKTGETD
ncbi:hypothetical protein [Kluyvera sp. CHPC 1.2972]|uniref:hypothetical protein n=1 Tax=Kluyvera sp. CHPC 1.2972 TaxID=2995176 RepID=UPI002FD7C554